LQIGEETLDEKDIDNRFDIDYILNNHSLGRVYPNMRINWVRDRFYSVLDIEGHPVRDASLLIIKEFLKKSKVKYLKQKANPISKEAPQKKCSHGDH
jgi:hypothetical protein